MMLKTVASFALGRGLSLHIARGSVLDFSLLEPTTSGGVGAIVNAANEGCLGGGGVDGAINAAGGPNLWKDRQALPVVVPGSMAVRCVTGDAVITGPGDYDQLRVPYVIHAVGPDYNEYQGMQMESCKNDNFAVPDRLLMSAYQRALERCKENGITDVAFSLLSAGIFRGRQSIQNVLAIGITGIQDWVQSTKDVGQLKTVTLCGFSENEASLLLSISKEILGGNVKESHTEDDRKDVQCDKEGTNNTKPIS
jgi:O-acetyl-ADP-ribose deacetylase